MLEDFAMFLEVEGRSENTIKTYLWIMSHFLEFVKKDPYDITKEDIFRYLAFLKKHENYDSNSIRLVVSALRKYFQYLGRTEILQYLKAPKVDKRLPKFITIDELNKLVSVVENKRDRLIILMLFYTGARVSELVNLKKSDIIWNEGFVRIRKGKGGKERYVPLPDFLLEELKEYLENVSGEYIFPSKKGEKITQRQVQRIIKKAAEKAGIKKKVTPHVLRHSLATYLLQKGVNLRIIQELLGHSSLSVTQIYTHVLPVHLRETYKRIFENTG